MSKYLKTGKRLVGNRRDFLRATAAGAATLALPAVWARGQGRTLTVGVTGGYGDTWQKILFEPFTAATGVPINEVLRRDNAIAEFQVMVESGNYDWDVGVNFSDEAYIALEQRDFLGEFDLTGRNIASLPELMRTDRFVGFAITTGVLAYRTDTVPQGLTSFADLWDFDGIPGRRSLRRHPIITFETVMRADGIEPADVYRVLSTEEGWSRALAKLNEIRDHIPVWWEGGAQVGQILQTNEVDMTPAFSARIQPLIDEGSPLAINWFQSFWHPSGWLIPKGAPNTDLAQQFVEFVSNPERQAAFVQAYPIGPSHPGVIDYLPEDLARTLNTHPDNMNQGSRTNMRFWVENQELAHTRLNEWLLG